MYQGWTPPLSKNEYHKNRIDNFVRDENLEGLRSYLRVVIKTGEMTEPLIIHTRETVGDVIWVEKFFG